MGYMRPPGTFSFTSGYVAFQALVGCILLYFLVMNNTLQDKYRFSNIVLIILVGCYLLTIPMSISRTHFFQTCVFLLFLGMAVIRKEKLKERFLKFVLVACIAGMLLSMIGIADTGIDAFTARFEGANRTEGGVEGVIGNRYIGGLFAGLFNWDVPVLGYGLGLGTNVGAKLMNASGRDSFGFYAEVEWGRIVGECGLLIGIAIVAIRVSFSFNLIQAAYRNLLKKNEILAWMLSSAMILYLPQGQWGIPMMLGFGTLLGGFVLVSLKDSECNS